MKIKTYIAPLGLFLLLLSSCKKDTDIIVLNPGQGLDTTWYSNYNAGMKAVQLKNELTSDIFSTDVVTINNSGSTSFYICNNSFAITFPSNSIVDTSGNYYRGTVIITSKLLLNNGAHISSFRTSKDNNGKLLQNLFTFYFAIKDQNNNELFIEENSYITARIHVDNPFFSPSPTNLYFGNDLNLLSTNWIQPGNNNFNYIEVISSENFNVNFNQTGWVNCSKTYYSNTQQTKIAVTLPSNYTNANTIAYLLINNKNIELQFDPNVGARQFQIVNVPSGLSAKLVIMSKQGNSYFLGHSDFYTSAISTTGGYQQITVTPTITSIDNIKNFLNNL